MKKPLRSSAAATGGPSPPGRKKTGPAAAKAGRKRKAAPGCKSPQDIRDCELWLRFEALLADLSARFVNLPPDEVDAEIEKAQRRVCECLELDLSAFWEWETDQSGILLLTHLYRPLGGPPVPERMVATENFPWCLDQLSQGNVIVLPRTDDAPPEAAVDLASWRHYGIKSNLGFPLAAGGGEMLGVLSFCTTRTERLWTEPQVKRLGLIAQVFANAIVRQRIEQALRESEERLSLATEAAGIGTWELDGPGRHFLVAAQIMDLFGLPPVDRLEVERFLALVHAEDRETVQEAMRQGVNSREMKVVEYRISRPDGPVRWMVSQGRLCDRGAGKPPRLMGVTADITERKQGEEALRLALDEVKRLRDRLQQENVYLREQVFAAAGHGDIVGESKVVRRMLGLARKVAPTDSAVLITGETGTGKELLAQFIHDLSPRKTKTMVKVNCAALPGPLIESELFGREKGAYTGAMTRQIGRFEVADGSTIFLDEIGDLPLDLQAKLLRVLQDGQYERLGSHSTLKTDVRVIAATNHNLGAMVREGKFREDLFHRLSVFPIEVPPLRARVEDIPLLVWKIVQEFNTKIGRAIESIPAQSMDQLKRYPWPGNIRELRNLIERAMILSDGRSLEVAFPGASTGSAVRPDTLEEMERRHILDVLERARWRISGRSGAAEILGLLPTTLHSRMKKLGITRPPA